VQAADILARSPSPIGRLGSVEEGAGTVAGSGKALGDAGVSREACSRAPGAVLDVAVQKQAELQPTLHQPTLHQPTLHQPTLHQPKLPSTVTRSTRIAATSMTRSCQGRWRERREQDRRHQ
jgi:hypothetical protein